MPTDLTHDPYRSYSPISLTAPAENAVAVTAHDTDPTGAKYCRGLYIGGAGDVVVTMLGEGTDVVFKAVPAGTILPIRVERVDGTNTTATDIVAIY
jgi:hypothetical protein